MEGNKRGGIAIGGILSLFLGTPAEARPVLRQTMNFSRLPYGQKQQLTVLARWSKEL